MEEEYGELRGKRRDEKELGGVGVKEERAGLGMV